MVTTPPNGKPEAQPIPIPDWLAHHSRSHRRATALIQARIRTLSSNLLQAQARYGKHRAYTGPSVDQLLVAIRDEVDLWHVALTTSDPQAYVQQHRPIIELDAQGGR